MSFDRELEVKVPEGASKAEEARIIRQATDRAVEEIADQAVDKALKDLGF
ncbi:MAG: hypothetical protein KJ792_04580 [Actinobacteria bacterium]|nr:hypothetical protein [Actinomycetota bacterium]MCG2801281.1 hypothetical protein [Cellulomonas sp.]